MKIWRPNKMRHKHSPSTISTMMRTSLRWRIFTLFGCLLLVGHCNSFVMLRSRKPDPCNRSVASAIPTQTKASSTGFGRHRDRDLAPPPPSPSNNEHPNRFAPKYIALRIWDTKSLVLDAKTMGLAASTLGFWGHSGLAMVSIVVVKAVYAYFFAPNSSAPIQAGILNRCPWPFIFFHDVKQGFKDSPTWIVLTWLALWRLSKIVLKPPVVP